MSESNNDAALALARSIAGNWEEESPPESRGNASETPPSQQGAPTGQVQNQSQSGESREALTPSGEANKETPPAQKLAEGEGEKPAVPPAPSPPSLDQLLKDSTLGPQLMSWADQRHAAQMRGQTERLRQQVRQEVTDDVLRERFKSLDKEKLGELLANDEEAAQAYARLLEQENEPEINPEAFAASAQVYAFAAQIATYNAMMEEAGLAPEVRTKLDPSNFTNQGPRGIIEWGKAVNKALVDKTVEEAVQAQLETRWQAYKEEQEAASPPPSRPGMTPGKPTGKNGALPDVVNASQSELFDAAFKQ